MLLYFCLFVFLNVLCRPISKCSQLTTLVTAECVRTLHMSVEETRQSCMSICLSILLFFRPTLLQKQHTMSCNISARITAPAKKSAIPQFFCQHSTKETMALQPAQEGQPGLLMRRACQCH